jgi:hypothetical protein
VDVSKKKVRGGLMEDVEGRPERRLGGGIWRGEEKWRDGGEYDMSDWRGKMEGWWRV